VNKFEYYLQYTAGVDRHKTVLEEYVYGILTAARFMPAREPAVVYPYLVDSMDAPRVVKAFKSLLEAAANRKVYLPEFYKTEFEAKKTAIFDSLNDALKTMHGEMSDEMISQISRAAVIYDYAPPTGVVDNYQQSAAVRQGLLDLLKSFKYADDNRILENLVKQMKHINADNTDEFVSLIAPFTVYSTQYQNFSSESLQNWVERHRGDPRLTKAYLNILANPENTWPGRRETTDEKGLPVESLVHSRVNYPPKCLRAVCLLFSQRKYPTRLPSLIPT
jgi:hypothetical protein